MTQPTTSALDRLVALATEAEKMLALGFISHDVRHICALARGYLELARSYGEPVKVEDVERLLGRLRVALSDNLPDKLKSSLPPWLEPETAGQAA